MQQTIRYWSLMANATTVRYPPTGPSDPPTLWNYRQCMEVDGQFFYKYVFH